MTQALGTGMGTKPRWDKYDGYVGNFRTVLAADVNLATQANQVIPVGLDSNGAAVLGGAGQSGIVGVAIIAVGTDMSGNLLDGGINTEAGDTVDVGKHGEITNFKPRGVVGSHAVVVTVGSGNYTLTVVNPDGVGKLTGNIAFDAAAATLDTAISAVDDGLATAGVTVTGTAPNFTVVLADGYTLLPGTGATVTPGSNTPAAGTKYYAHSDGTIDTNASGGVYIGHTAEADRLIVNVIEV